MCRQAKKETVGLNMYLFTNIHFMITDKHELSIGNPKKNNFKVNPAVRRFVCLAF